jgi:hypothetical protein
MIVVAVLTSTGCGSPSGGPLAPAPAAVAVSSAQVVESPSPLEEQLSAKARFFREHANCEDTCCLGLTFGAAPYWREVPSPEQAQSLRDVLRSPARAEVRGLAARWLSDRKDVTDLPLLLACATSIEPAGAFPSVSYGQVVLACDTLEWEDKTLGRACLDAMGAIVSATFADVEQAKAWMAAHPDPLDDYDYWRQVLTTRPAYPEQLERLSQRGPTLFLRVTAQEPQLLGDHGKPMFSKAARDVGPDRLLRILRRQESWPELDGAGFNTFATTVFQRAQTIFDASHGPELLAMWEDRSCCEQDFVWVALTVAVSRVMPSESRRVLKHALQTSTTRTSVLEELARQHAVEEQALLSTWYVSRPGRDDDDDYPTAIFEGLAGAGARVRPVLASLLRKHVPTADNRAAVIALVKATKAVGHAMPATCDGYLFAVGGKGMSKEDHDRAEAEMVRVRKACISEAVRLLRGPAPPAATPHLHVGRGPSHSPSTP